MCAAAEPTLTLVQTVATIPDAFPVEMNTRGRVAIHRPVVLCACCTHPPPHNHRCGRITIHPSGDFVVTSNRGHDSVCYLIIYLFIYLFHLQPRPRLGLRDEIWGDVGRYGTSNRGHDSVRVHRLHTLSSPSPLLFIVIAARFACTACTATRRRPACSRSPASSVAEARRLSVDVADDSNH